MLVRVGVSVVYNEILVMRLSCATCECCSMSIKLFVILYMIVSLGACFRVSRWSMFIYFISCKLLNWIHACNCVINLR